MSSESSMSAWYRLNQPLTTERSSKYRFSVRYVPFLLKKLQSLYGNKGYTNNLGPEYALSIKDHIRYNYSHDQVNAAHLACIADAQHANNNQRSSFSRRKPEMNFQTGTVENEPSVEDAIFGDDTPRDNAWLDTNKEPEAKQDNTQVQDMSDYVTKHEARQETTRLVQLIDNAKTNVERAHAAVVNAIGEKLAAANDRITVLENARPTIVELKRPDALETITLGVQHKQFPLLLQMCHARETIWLHGPAGTGKSTAGEKVAEALGLAFYTNGKLENQFEVLGFVNATGRYQETEFRRAYENGGIYLADEIDGSMPSAVLALNGALANGHCPFPDKTVKRHKDFIFIGAANTTGMGGTLEYVGRMKHDAAFLDRFVTLDWPLDEALEDAITPNKSWLAYVRAARRNLAKNPIKGHLITPRASIKGSNLLHYGVNIDSVIAGALRKGLSEAQWNQIKPSYKYIL